MKSDPDQTLQTTIKPKLRGAPTLSMHTARQSPRSEDDIRPALIVSMLLALPGLSGCGTESARGADRELAATFADVLDLYNARLDLTAQALAHGHLPLDAPVLARVFAVLENVS